MDGWMPPQPTVKLRSFILLLYLDVSANHRGVELWSMQASVGPILHHEVFNGVLGFLSRRRLRDAGQAQKRR